MTNNINNTKIYALYFPQFHEVELNNKLWGKSFTDWDWVRKAKPLFKGHKQPVKPLLGYYDASKKETIVKQVNLANNFGIDGFIIYFYMFKDDFIVMDTPLNIIYDNKDININYCIYWVNEDWTNTWYGSEKEVLMKQHNLRPKIFKETIQKYLDDPRYIRVDGKPLVMFHRDTQNGRAVNAHVKQTCFTIMKDNNPKKAIKNNINIPTERIYDTYYERLPDIKWNVAKYEKGKNMPKIYRYDSINKISNKTDEYIRSVFVSFDNTPRRTKTTNGVIVSGSNPHKFELYLRDKMMKTAKYNNKHLNFVIVNAWNECSEGNNLEPDDNHGYGYLNVIKKLTSGK
jgi:hypothetical protein